MSTEWFISAFENKEYQNISIENIMEIFSDHIIKKYNEYIEIELNGDTVTLFFDLTEDKVSTLMVSRPIVNNELNILLFKIMKLGNFILYAPGGAYPILLTKDIEKEFPDDMIESLGKPKIAENEEGFVSLLNKIYGEL